VAELNEFEWELGGSLLGAAFVMKETSGLEDDPTIGGDATERGVDGVVPGPLRRTDRVVTLRVGVRFTTVEATEDAIDAVRALVAPLADRTATRALRWRHRGVTKVLQYLPAKGEALEVPGNWEALVVDYVTCTARLWCPNPDIYSDAVTSTAVSGSSGSPVVVELTNAGTFTALAPGSFTWSITAGGCTGLFVEHVDFPGERWELAESVGAGDVVTVDAARITRVDGVRRSSTVKGAAVSPVPTWPALRPGANDVRVGCSAGSFSGSLSHRSTW
jgi:hypothetical protein